MFVYKSMFFLFQFFSHIFFAFLCMPFIGSVSIDWLGFLHIVFNVDVFCIHFCFVVAFFCKLSYA